MRHITQIAGLVLALLTSLAVHAQTGALHHSLQVTLDPSTSQISVTDTLTLPAATGTPREYRFRLNQALTLQTLQGSDDPIEQLSAREFEIFRLLAEGQDSEAIAQALKISGKTVANYQTIIKQKLGINNPVELVRLAIRYGVIDS